MDVIQLMFTNREMLTTWKQNKLNGGLLGFSIEDIVFHFLVIPFMSSYSWKHTKLSE